jgi:ketosteroid isomerase-like protein
MSQANLELLQRGFEHVTRTGQLLPDTVHADLVWDTTTFSTMGLNLKKCIGLAEANRWLEQWADAFDDWSLDIEENREVGDEVVTIVRQRARPKHGGPEVEMRFAQVWAFRDGLVVRMEMYADIDEALAVAGRRAT